jgi:hypothetical protein
MYFYFVDETKAQPDQDFTVVGGIVLSETDYPIVLREFNSIKRKYNIDPAYEIRWSSMRRSKDEKMSYDERELLRREILKLAAKSNITIVSGVVHLEKAREKGFTEDFQIYCVGLMVASERLQYYMQDIGREQNKKCYSIIIAHRYGSHKDAKKINCFCRQIAESGTVHLKVKLSNVLINLLFSPTEISPLIQLSDFCIGGLATFLNRGKREYYDIYDFKFRKSQASRIEGYGIVFYPLNPGANVEIVWPF